MALTEHLMEFWHNLNKGFIDWKYLESDAPAEARRKAIDWVVQRGFVKLFEKGQLKFHGGRSPYFAATDPEGHASFPMIDKKIGVFTGSRYAINYASHLNRFKKESERGYKKENLNAGHLERKWDYREFKFE